MHTANWCERMSNTDEHRDREADTTEAAGHKQTDTSPEESGKDRPVPVTDTQVVAGTGTDGGGANTDDGGMGASRRQFVATSLIAGMAGLTPSGVVASGGDEGHRRGELDRDEPPTGSTDEIDPDELATAISTDEFATHITDTEYRGVDVQATAFEDTELQEFPEEGEEFVVMSSGEADDAPGDPETFVSTNVDGRNIPNYSPDDFDAFNIVDLRIDFEVPEGAKSVQFDFRFGTVENPGFLGSDFQDFFEANLILPNGSVENVGVLPENEPVTVDNAAPYSNDVNGSSQNPEPPFPDPPDVTYNAVTSLQTGARSLEGFEGQEVRLVLRVADASDGVFDSAVFVDNLRFGDDVEFGAQPALQAIDNYSETLVADLKESMLKEAQVEAQVYQALGEEFVDTFLSLIGFEAGQVSADELDDEVLETFELVKTDNPVTDKHVNELHDFYQELYDAAADTPEDELEDLFYQYFMGTHPDQDATLNMGGGTLDELLTYYSEELVETWLEAFEVELEEELDAGELDGADIQQMVSFIDGRAADLDTALFEQEREATNLETVLIEDGEFDAGGFGVDIEPDEDLQANAPPLVPILVYAGAWSLKKLGVSAAVGGFTTKAVGAIKGSVAFKTITSISVGGKIGAGLSKGKAAAVWAGKGLWKLNAPTTVPKQVSGFVGGAKWTAKDFVKGEVIDTISGPVPTGIGDEIIYQEAVTPVVEEGVDAAGTGLSFAADKGKQTGEWAYDEVTDRTPDIDLPDPDISVPSNPFTDGVGPAQVQIEDRSELFDEMRPISRRYADLGQAGTDIVDVSAENLDLSDIANDPDIIFEDGVFFVQATGTITIENTGNVEFTPAPVVEIRETNVPPTGNSISTGYPIVVSEALDPIDPGTTETFEVTYAAPVGLFTAEYELAARTETGGTTVTDSFETGILPFEMSETELAAGSISDGEEHTELFEPATDEDSATFALTYDPVYDIDLHLFDDQGNHTGFDYDADELIEEVPNSSHGGDDEGTLGEESITVESMTADEYEVVVVAPELESIIQGDVDINADNLSIHKQTSPTPAIGIDSEYDLTVTTVPELEPTAQFLQEWPRNIFEDGGETLELSAEIREASDTGELPELELSATGLTAEDPGTSIPAENVSVEPATVDLDAGESTSVTVTVEVPDGLPSGLYAGELAALPVDGDDDGGTTTELVLNNIPPVPPVVGDDPPLDLTGDGLLEDVDGDGEFTIFDVQALFENLDEIPGEHADKFDFAGLADGRVTVFDVQVLYTRLGE